MKMIIQQIELMKKYMHLDFDKIASKLCVSAKLVKLKYDNLSVDKKKEFEEFYNDNYSFLHPI